MAPLTKQHLYRDARDAYFHGGKTQKEIAKEVGISERTLRNWIKESCWDRLRKNANIAPVVMLDHFCSQLVQLQNKVAARSPEERVPKSSEVERQRKLLNCIIRMKDYPTEDIKYFASRMNTVSDEVFDDEETQTEEKEDNNQSSLSSLYTTFPGQPSATHRNQIGNKPAIFSEAGNEQGDAIQLIDNEHNTAEFEEGENAVYCEKAAIFVETTNRQSNASNLALQKLKTAFTSMQDDSETLNELRCLPPEVSGELDPEPPDLNGNGYVTLENIKDLCSFTYDNRPTTTGERIMIEHTNKRIRNELTDMYQHPKIYPIGRFKVYDFRLHTIRTISPQEWNHLLYRDYTQQQLELALG